MGGGFLLKGGGVSCFFCTTGGKKSLQDCRCGLSGGDERENPPWEQGVLVGGGSEFPAGYDVAEVMAPSLLQIFVCRNVFRHHHPEIDCTLEALFPGRFKVQTESGDADLTPGPIS